MNGYHWLPLALGLAISAPTHAAERYQLSLPNLNLADDERVVGITFSIDPGRIVRLREFPIAWWLSIDNPTGDKTTLTGGIHVGAAALNKSDAQAYFRNWLEIEKPDDTCKPKSDSKACMPLAISMDVVVTSDFEHERHVTLSASNLTFTPATQ